MNNLIVEATTPTAKDCAEGLRIIGPGLVIKDGIDRDNWLVESIGGISMASDVAGFITDPIASMAASAASFLMEYMAPLREALDALAGSPAAVAAQGQTWTSIATRVNATADDYVARTATALTGWSGPAATGYRAFVGSYTEILGGVSTLCSGVSSAMAGATAVVGFVRTVVRETIAELVGKLVSWAVQVLATGGAGASWVVPQAARAIHAYVQKVTKWSSDLAESIKNLCKNVEGINDCLESITPLITRIRTYLDAPLVPAAPAIPYKNKDGIPMLLNSLNTGASWEDKASKNPE